MAERPPSVIDFSDYITDRTKDFVGREWVFTEIDSWLADPERSSVFLLTGNPGSGKSAVMARLAQISQGETAILDCSRLTPGFLCHFHFCQVNKDATLSPLRYVEALSQSLANHYRPFTEALLKQQDRDININVQQTASIIANGGQITGVIIKNLHISSLSPRAAFDRAVRIPLEALCSKDFLSPIVILLDSLDEAMSWDEDDNIAALLADAFNKPGNLPSQVHAILASRRDEQIESWFGRPALDLLDNAPLGAHDIQSYVYQQLAAGSEQQRQQIAHRLDRAARGNFLYARYALGSMTPTVDLPNLPTLPHLPRDLDEIYQTFIERRLANSQKHWKQVRPLLGALVVARDNGLTRAQLQGIMDLFKELTTDETDDLLSICSQYLAGTQPAGPFHIYHQSFREFLYHSAEFSIYPVEANKAIADFFLQTHGDNWLACEDEYALRYTRVHLQEAAKDTVRPEDKIVHAKITEKLVALDRDESYRAARIRKFSKGELTPAMESFVSRAATGFIERQWVLYRLNSWLESPESRHLLLVGGAGTGKTALAARLWQFSRGLAPIDELKFPQLSPGFLTYAHFYHPQDHTSLDPLSFLEGLSRMLVYRYKDYARLYVGQVLQRTAPPRDRSAGAPALDLPQVKVDQIVKSLEPGARILGMVVGQLIAGDPVGPLEFRHALDEFELSDGVFVQNLVSRFRGVQQAVDALLEPLSQLCRENPRLRVVILLDGLDQAVQVFGGALLNLLRLMDRLPDQVGFVLFSRPLPEIMKALGPAQIDFNLASPKS